jgi:GalNAc-alpha-(1->4)-GalNAc-alpha-(1->3)-diNAcBac-PP-undecaprenol alpha-1,4-N-acetyl-D-galactosaminyltransferase
MVIADLSAGGAQRVFSQLANAWAAEGRNISVVTLSGADTDFFHLASEIRRNSIAGLAPSHGPISAIRANLRRLFALRSAFRASGAKRLLSFTGSMNVLTVLAASGMDIRVTISERNDPARQSLGRVWDFLRRRIYPMADLVTANSQGALASLSAFVPAEKLAFLPNPIGQQSSTVKARLNGPTILNIGRLNRQKGQDVLIDAFAQIAQVREDWCLMIIGSGECEGALRQRAMQRGVAERVSFVGQVDDPFPYYRAAQIFALPSRYEGTPNVLLEAMSAAMPCIVSDASGGPLEYIADGESGLVVPVEDVARLSSALETLMDAPDLRARLGAAGRERLGQHGFGQVLAAWAEALDLPPAADRTR